MYNYVPSEWCLVLVVKHAGDVTQPVRASWNTLFRGEMSLNQTLFLFEFLLPDHRLGVFQHISSPDTNTNTHDGLSIKILFHYKQPRKTTSDKHLIDSKVLKWIMN